MTTRSQTRDSRLEIRCTKPTMVNFLELRAHFKSHEETLEALLKFWKDNHGERTLPMKGTVN